jgi:hypothetical protein
MHRSLSVLASMTFLLGACSYPVQAPVSPALNVYTSYADKLPGNYVLVVEASSWDKVVKSSSYQCSAHNFPMNANAVFKESVTRTVEQLVESVEVATVPPSRETMSSKRIAGVILVKADTFEPKLTFIPGFWSATASAAMDVSAALTVDGPQGRLLGTSAGASRSADGEAGDGCGGGANVLADATSKALRDLMERLGERIGNAPKLREASFKMS